eukprot:CAMPEP_0172661614 /NCGR_PEP_ID=MMETSP1074-20121228/4813_1 /TAXON_ID=2916 /ORGANISM="Ceratium fusus, Strain PA161109" /LENGTH=370 /DNA_ID=CAMNT_0013477407 /DNA_START=69 /DNA_END=1182 /DNA_ORIENTATION=+
MSSATSAATGAPALLVVPPASLQVFCTLQRKPPACSSNLALASAALTAATLVGQSQACSFATTRKSRAALRRRGGMQRADGARGGVINKLLGGDQKQKLEDPEVMDQRMRERRQRELAEFNEQLSEREPSALASRLENARKRSAQAAARARTRKERKEEQTCQKAIAEAQQHENWTSFLVSATSERPKEQTLEGWRLVVMACGTWFYANELSGTRSWEAPVPSAPTLARQPSEVSSEVSKETKSWLRVLDLMSGSWYYYDEQSACSSWEAPHGMRMAECPPPPPSPWRRVLHISSCEWCYLNEETRETRWELPPPAKECEVVGDVSTAIAAKPLETTRAHFLLLELDCSLCTRPRSGREEWLLALLVLHL